MRYLDVKSLTSTDPLPPGSNAALVSGSVPAGPQVTVAPVARGRANASAVIDVSLARFRPVLS
jgi:hypothetical protein